MELLFEIGAEEIPAGFIGPALERMRAALVAELSEARLGTPEVRVYGTPRRLALIATGIEKKQPDVKKEVTGPPRRVAYDAEGKPTPAAIGFARGQGIPVEKLEIVQTPKGEVVGAHIREKGRPAVALLPGILEKIVRAAAQFPKAMRWGDGDAVFARPVQWMLALVDGKALKLKYGDVESGRVTFGHRFLSPKAIKIASAGEYVEKLRAASVLADMSERRAAVKTEAARAAGEGRIVADTELLDTVTNLVEWPAAVAGSFDASYLDLPREVVVSEMRGHQKYFAVEDATGALVPSFVAVANTPVKDTAVSRVGYERVLRARLADARFFFDEDRKRKLESRVADLARMTFHFKLGSQLERVERIKALGLWLGEGTGDTNRDHLERAAHLCKADLTTGMVGEFPELQGIMGSEYAKHEGEPGAVALAIREHYRPRFLGDEPPANPEGAVLGIADRLDTLCGIVAATGKLPTGSADPFALRRAALGIVRIVLARGYRVALRELIAESLRVLGAKATVPTAADMVLDFFRGRLKAFFAEKYPADSVEAVLAAGFDDLVAVEQRLAALAAVRTEADFTALAAAFKRAGNILEKAPADTPAEPDSSALSTDEERALLDAVQHTRERIRDADGNYTEALRALAAVKPQVDAFFDKVLVMDPDEAVRRNRFALLKSVTGLFSGIADFSQLQS